jgi:hypothetical protein
VSLVNVRVIVSVVDIRAIELSKLLCPLWISVLLSYLSYCVRCESHNHAGI